MSNTAISVTQDKWALGAEGAGKEDRLSFKIQPLLNAASYVATAIRTFQITGAIENSVSEPAQLALVALDIADRHCLVPNLHFLQKPRLDA